MLSTHLTSDETKILVFVCVDYKKKYVYKCIKTYALLSSIFIKFSKSLTNFVASTCVSIKLSAFFIGKKLLRHSRCY